MSPGTGVAANDAERAHVEKIRAEFRVFRERNNYDDVNIDSVTALDVVRHLIDSIGAYEKFHAQEADDYVWAAHWVYWLVKLKPAYLRHGNLSLEEIDSKYANYRESGYNSVNENFAFGVALDILDIDPGAVSDDLRERFIDMLYRCNLDPWHLALTLELLFGYTGEAERVKDLQARLALVGQLIKP